MGSYDEVHTGYRCGQTKALGKGFARYVTGDKVCLQPAVMTQQQADLHGPSVMPAQPDVTNFDVAMAVGYLHVRDGRIAGWDDDIDPTVLLVGYNGWPLDLGEPLFTVGKTPIYANTPPSHDPVIPKWNCTHCATERAKASVTNPDNG